jgi:hypothetical protein
MLQQQKQKKSVMLKVDRMKGLRGEKPEPLKKKGQTLIPVIRTWFSF